MNDPSRPNASLITDDQLDALYAELDTLRALVDPRRRSGAEPTSPLIPGQDNQQLLRQTDTRMCDDQGKDRPVASGR